MTGRRHTAHGLIAGSATFVAATAGLLIGTTLLTDWRAPHSLQPLHPVDAPAPERIAPSTISTTALEFDVDDSSVHALLTAPRGGASSAAVLVAGAGQADRRTLLPLAEELARAGIAALTYDKRQDGYTPLRRDFDRLADDAVLAVTALRRATGLPSVGVLGVSEGGWVVSTAAGRPNSPVSFAVLVSAPVVSPLEQVTWAADQALERAPLPLRRVAAAVLASGRPVIDYLDFDCRPALATTRAPVLALWGADDPTVPVNEAYRRLRTALRGDLSARIVADTGHDLLRDPSSWLPAAARWMRAPQSSSVTGTEPRSNLGVSTVPQQTWFTDSRLHLAVSLTLSLFIALIVRRRGSGRHGRSSQ